MKKFLPLAVLLIITIMQSCSSEEPAKSYYPKISEEDKKEIARIEGILEKSDENLCSIFTKIYDNEGENIATADKKHPDFGAEHSKLVSELDKKFRTDIKKKYSLSESDLSFLTLIGLQKCK